MKLLNNYTNNLQTVLMAVKSNIITYLILRKSTARYILLRQFHYKLLFFLNYLLCILTSFFLHMQDCVYFKPPLLQDYQELTN